MKILTSLIFVLILLSSHNIMADQKNRAELELPSLSIKLSNDGTGIIKNASCGYCNFNFVKITHATRVFVNGVTVDVQRAAGRAGKAVFIEFDSTTAEVLAIRWAE